MATNAPFTLIPETITEHLDLFNDGDVTRLIKVEIPYGSVAFGPFSLKAFVKKGWNLSEWKTYDPLDLFFAEIYWSLIKVMRNHSAQDFLAEHGDLSFDLVHMMISAYDIKPDVDIDVAYSEWSRPKAMLGTTTVYTGYKGLPFIPFQKVDSCAVLTCLFEWNRFNGSILKWQQVKVPASLSLHSLVERYPRKGPFMPLPEYFRPSVSSTSDDDWGDSDGIPEA
jgi:hypothetical protein